MKISILKENLSKALGIVGHAVSNKNDLEILNNILIKTENGQIKFEATDLEIGISYYIGGKIDKEGSVTVPAKLFTELISTIPHQKVTLELKDNFLLQCKSENFNSNIKSLSSEDFPIIPEIKKGKKIKFNKKELREAILLTTFAAATDESRPILSGVYLKAEKGTLILAATDSYRLAEKRIRVTGNEEFQIIVPYKPLIELARILEGEGEGEMVVGENQIFIESEHLGFVSRLIEGEFPDYKKIIPTNLENTIEVNKEEFLDGVKAASIFSRENSRSIKLNIKNKGEMEISSLESQTGDSLAVVEVEVKGKGGEITFNSRYLLDVLNNIKDEKLIFKMNDKVSPGVFQGEKTEDYLYIIMPLRS